MSTRDSASTHFSDRFRLVIGQRANQAASTVALGTGVATATPDLNARMFAAGDVHTLTRAIVGAIGVPVSGLSIAAVLESQGWTDADAQALFQRANLMDLGQEIARESWLIHKSESAEGRPTSAYAVVAQVSGGNLHLRGPYFLAIAFLQIAGLALAGVSFGAGFGLTTLEATATGAGLLFGLLWASGFGQLLARDPWSLHLQGHDVLAGLAAFRVIGLSMGSAALTCGIVCALVFAALRIVPEATEAVVAALGLGMTCFLLIILFWLLVNALMAMGLGAASLVATGLSMASMIALATLAPIDLPRQATAVVGLVLACVFMSGKLATWWMSKRRHSPPNRRLPRLTGTVIDEFGYVIYGAGLMLLIILDRFVAWHVGAPAGWLSFQAPYEIGLGWALMAFLIAVVGQEWVLAKFLRWINHRMAWFLLSDTQGYQRDVRDAYWSRLTLAVTIAVASAVVMVSFLFWASTAVPWLRPILPTAEGLPVFRWGLLGYCLLSVAVFNTGLLIAVSQPGRLILPLAFALSVDLAVALTSAQILGYSASVLGLVAGAMVLLVSSTFQVMSFLKTPAYGLY
ncbi:MAG: hypothetical protein WA040_15335 [Anaerolineae bacterium]